MKLQLRMLISLLPAAMAEFDNCDLANSKWIGFDQVITVPRRLPRTHVGRMDREELVAGRSGLGIFGIAVIDR